MADGFAVTRPRVACAAHARLDRRHRRAPQDAGSGSADRIQRHQRQVTTSQRDALELVAGCEHRLEVALDAERAVDPGAGQSELAGAVQ
jgi:hypothetical protein